MRFLRGVRGATQVTSNTAENICYATVELLSEMIEQNGIETTDIAFVYFSATADLDATFPPLAARDTLKWTQVPLMCGLEMNVPHSLKKCLRVLITWNTDKNQGDIKHVYLHGAKKLRPDLSNNQ